MLDRLDEWRARLQGRQPAVGARSDPQPEPGSEPAPDARRPPEDYGPCPSCGGGREVVMRPMGGDAARLGLVCTECGNATGI